MDIVRNYVFTIICAATISGIIIDLSKNTFFHKQLKFLCGIYVAMVFVSPLTRWTLPSLNTAYAGIQSEARAASEEGTSFQIRSLAGIIKDQCEAYILKEASFYNAEISAQVTVVYLESPQPVEVIIRGSFDAACETELSRMIERELHIPKEKQTWIRQDMHCSDSS